MKPHRARRAGRQKAIATVPRWMLAFLTLAFVVQVAMHGAVPPPRAGAAALPVAPGVDIARLLSLGEPAVLGHVYMLYLQAFDNQPGISIPFRELDFARVIGWLGLIAQLDPRGDYPHLFASRLYAEVPDPPRQRAMLDFVYRSFLQDPNRRWRWLAHGVVLARHRLHDLPLAMKFAQAIRRYATGPEVPHWATQMEIFVLEDMNELEAAKVLLGGLISSGQITDPHEMHFLTMRHNALEKRLAGKTAR